MPLQPEELDTILLYGRKYQKAREIVLRGSVPEGFFCR
jgi:hypothetical protein